MNNILSARFLSVLKRRSIAIIVTAFALAASAQTVTEIVSGSERLPALRRDLSVQTVSNTVPNLPLTDDPIELQARNPYLKLLTNSEGKILLDYQYTSTNGTPVIRPEITIDEQGATARNGRHRVEFDGNLNRDDAVTIRLPEGGVLQGRPAALSVSDGFGRRAWLGVLKDCQGEVVGERANQVLYADAFAGIKADVLYTYELNSIEQDIIFRENPILPAELDVASARIEVFTEFFNPPAPVSTFQKAVFRAAGVRGQEIVSDDELLDFGSMRIVRGAAFQAEAAPDARPNRAGGATVVKQWIRDGEKTFLVENVDYESIKPSLQKLRAQAQASSLTSDDGLDHITKPSRPAKSSRSRTALVRAGSRSSNRELVASASNLEPGVVLDYLLVSTALLDVDFGNGCVGTHGYVYKTAGSDFWTSVKTPTFSYSNLKWSDQSLSGITLDVLNASGHWCVSCSPGYPSITSPMFNDYIYPGGGGNITLTFNNIPPGVYDFYVYGAWGGVYDPVNNPFPNGKYVLSVGGAAQGLKQTFLNSGWDTRANSGNWTENEHYVRYANITVGSGQAVTITAMPGGSAIPGGNIALVNGLQMVASGSANTPPTISNIPDQTTSTGVAVGPVSFTVGDAETPSSSLSVTAFSGNTTLVPNGNISLGGSGSSRTVTVTPAAGQTGSATITVTVSDGSAQASDTFVVTVTGSASYVEISKSGMVADASTTGWGWLPQYAIDGSLLDPGWHNDEGRVPGTDWLRVYLGNPAGYDVARVEYYPRQGAGNGTFLQYEIYVTDSTSTDMNQWGTPAASGAWSWPNGAERKTVDFATRHGKYVVFRCIRGANYDRYASADEIWVYQPGTGGTVATPAISPPTGTYASAQTVTITCATSGATIYYGVNQSNPTTQYTGSFQLGSSATIYAKATKTGMTDSSVTSSAITINIANPDSDGDGLPDSWENQYFGNLAQNGAGDWDGDGVTNLQEYQSGTNPTGFTGLLVFTPLQ